MGRVRFSDDRRHYERSEHDLLFLRVEMGDFALRQGKHTHLHGSLDTVGQVHRAQGLFLARPTAGQEVFPVAGEVLAVLDGEPLFLLVRALGGDEDDLVALEGQTAVPAANDRDSTACAAAACAEIVVALCAENRNGNTLGVVDQRVVGVGSRSE